MAQGRIAFGLAVFMAGASACGPERIAAPRTPPPSVPEPIRAIPADLDLVVRVDVRRIRQTLGDAMVDTLRSRGMGDVTSTDPETERLMTDALTHADVAVIGLRPGRSTDLSDSVLVLSGDFEQVAVRKYATLPPFDGGTDLGGAYRVYARRMPAERSAPARVYTRGSELMIFVSSAEIDSVERQVEHGAADAPLEPPALGVISLAARPASLATQIAARSPAAARLLEQSRLLRAHSDLNAGGVSAELELTFQTSESARRAADAASLFRRALAEKAGVSAEVARLIDVDAVGPALVARLSLDSAGLARISACAQDPAACS